MSPILFVFVVGVAVALVRRRFLVTPDGRTGGDPPARLLGWAVGLLAEQRQEWGQAMIGELDRLDGRARRWRFALGCVAAAVVVPPWGPAAAALAAMTAAAAGAGGLYVATHVHYRLHTDGWTWAGALILLLLLVGYVLGGGVLLRRPGVAGPGLVGALLVTAAWLAVGGFTFEEWLKPIPHHPWLIVLTPVLVGAGATLWGGGAAVGRRAARLATVTAALAVYLYGVLAVAVVGATGHDPSDGWTTAQIVADDLGNQAVFYLVALPLVTSTIGWAAAAATARLRFGSSMPAPAYLAVRTAGPGPAADPAPVTTQPQSRPAREAGGGTSGAIPAAPARRSRAWFLLLLSAALAAAAFLVLFTMLSPHA
ncbi:hypothetical protein [Dactylosporangium sp. NPDC006015]|uniref:hypothetical protein n=1 Tax=Dactylosporangium sp. NPDC006015 TaxID=3154576 RepID=UPI0033B13378